jgi:hypothetical protein
MDLRGRGGVAMHGIKGDFSPLQERLSQQGTHGGHFAGLGPREPLVCQDAPTLMGASQDHLFAGRPPQGFAINGDPLPLRGRFHAHPQVSKDQGIERFPLHAGEQPGQVRARDTSLNRRAGGLAQPRQAIVQEPVNGRNPRAPDHDGEDHATEDEGEIMAFAPLISRVGELLQSGKKR